MDRRPGRIGFPPAAVKVCAALLVLLGLLAVPGPRPRTTSEWRVLAVVVRRTTLTVPTLRGPRDLDLRTDGAEAVEIRRGLAAFAERVRALTSGRIAVRVEVISL